VNITNKLFVYGILKRGFQLDLEKKGCKFLGEAVLPGANLYHLGSGVGMKVADDGGAYGEVFEIPPNLWPWLDSIEGHPHNYRRVIVEPILCNLGEGGMNVKTWAYEFPHHTGPIIKSGKYEYTENY